VVGINTSAQIEAAIVDRPVHTILAEEFRQTQLGTLHFPYLIAEDFGHLYAARTFEEHAALLEDSLDGGSHERNERFLLRFVRPFGLDVAAAPKVVEELEATAALPAPRPDGGPAAGPLMRLALSPFAARAARRAAPERDRPPSLGRTLRTRVRELAEPETVVAGPWLDDEVGELLYWLPFLSWAESGTSGLREKLVVHARPSSLPWYGGIGSGRVAEEPQPGAARIEPALIADHRLELADRHRGFLHRLTSFARLSAPAPEGLDLPGRFVAVQGDAAVDGDTVDLDDFAAADRFAVLGRSRGYVGPYGAAAILAVLLGLPAVAIADELDALARNDVRVATEFLRPPTFGRLRVVAAAEPLLVQAE
jgi:hypothetical protein